MEISSSSSQQTFALGQNLGARLIVGIPILLYGNLGVGKTTLIQGLAQGLGISALPLSPSFVLVREYVVYKSKIKRFYHIDLYRLSTEAEIYKLGLGELFEDPQAITAIEWADRIGASKPKKRIDVTIRYDKGDERIITTNHIV